MVRCLINLKLQQQASTKNIVLSNTQLWTAFLGSVRMIMEIVILICL